MRKIISISLILFIGAISTYSQDNYKPNPEIKKFVGEWLTIYNGDTLIFNLVNKEKVAYANSGIYTDIILGYITYIKKADTIYKKQEIMLNGICGIAEPFNLFGNYTDPKGRKGRIFFTFLNKNDLKTLNLLIAPNADVLGINKNLPPIKIPQKLILKKID